MNPQLGVIAAESREEMAFWPVATIAYFFTQSGELWYLLVMAVVAVPGAFSYLFLKHIRRARKVAKAKQSRVNKVSRPGLSDKQLDTVSAMVAGDKDFITGYTMFGLNLIIGVVLYICLIFSFTSKADPELVGVGLFVLPLLTIAMAIAAWFW
ncbi:hypothetical protein ACLI4Q_05670 [Natrialbaceae archaeon A-CW1-1]